MFLNYAAWRKNIHFTDEEIIAAVEQDAEHQPNAYLRDRQLRLAGWLRKNNKITAWAIRIAMPILVRKCGLCGKTALYRYGDEGRCRTHRYDAPAWRDRWLKQKDAMAGERAADLAEADRDAQRRLAFHRACGRNKREASGS